MRTCGAWQIVGRSRKYFSHAKRVRCMAEMDRGFAGEMRVKRKRCVLARGLGRRAPWATRSPKCPNGVWGAGRHGRPEAPNVQTGFGARRRAPWASRSPKCSSGARWQEGDDDELIQGFFFIPGKYALSGACSMNSTFSAVMIPYFGFAAVPELAFVNVTA
jgi:hypothetical protein